LSRQLNKRWEKCHTIPTIFEWKEDERNMVGFVIGLLVGGVLGAGVICLVAIAKENEECNR